MLASTLNAFESKIRQIPLLYNLLRPTIPYINILFSVERDFVGLRLLSNSNRRELAIDIGFNDGLSSISILRNSNFRIVAFEPLSVNIPPLQKLILKDVTIHRFGLGSSNCFLKIYTPTFKKKRITPYSSVSSHLAVSNFSRDSKRNINQIGLIEETIEVRTLDSFELTPRFIKIDTEGTELDVLKGGTQTINRGRPAIMIEISDSVNFDSLQLFMSNFNYSVFLLKKRKFVRVRHHVSTIRNYWLLPLEFTESFEVRS
jgi:FkbM family methyltransferase